MPSRICAFASRYTRRERLTASGTPAVTTTTSASTRSDSDPTRSEQPGDCSSTWPMSIACDSTCGAHESTRTTSAARAPRSTLNATEEPTPLPPPTTTSFTPRSSRGECNMSNHFENVPRPWYARAPTAPERGDVRVLDDARAAALERLCELLVPGSSRVGPAVYVDAL